MSMQNVFKMPNLSIMWFKIHIKHFPSFTQFKHPLTLWQNAQYDYQSQSISLIKIHVAFLTTKRQWKNHKLTIRLTFKIKKKNNNSLNTHKVEPRCNNLSKLSHIKYPTSNLRYHNLLTHTALNYCSFSFLSTSFVDSLLFTLYSYTVIHSRHCTG